MKIHIHRGQNQIGGSIVEISSDNTRILIDIGVNLDDDQTAPIPQIHGLFFGEKKCDAVFISHYHKDHIGLVEKLIPEIPVYIGERAYNIIVASAKHNDMSVVFSPNYIHHKETIKVGSLNVTPLLCDHSAFDYYMFLIEENDKKILYTGDFRANGKLDFSKLLA